MFFGMLLRIAKRLGVGHRDLQVLPASLEVGLEQRRELVHLRLRAEQCWVEAHVDRSASGYLCVVNGCNGPHHGRRAFTIHARGGSAAGTEYFSRMPAVGCGRYH